jgi:hypothetical protein
MLLTPATSASQPLNMSIVPLVIEVQNVLDLLTCFSYYRTVAKV